MLLDLSLGKDAPVSGDITAAEVATAAGSDIETVRELAPKARSEVTHEIVSNFIYSKFDYRIHLIGFHIFLQCLPTGAYSMKNQNLISVLL